MNIRQAKKAREQRLSTAIAECLVFFAFSNQQFAENKTELQPGEKYVSIGAGGYMPKSKVELFDSMCKESEAQYKKDIAEHRLRRADIEYELHNHEAPHTGEVDATLSALGDDYTREEVSAVLHEILTPNLNQIK